MPFIVAAGEVNTRPYKGLPGFCLWPVCFVASGQGDVEYLEPGKAYLPPPSGAAPSLGLIPFL